MKGALTGQRIVEFTSYTAGPLCGELLLQLGAEVIKIEPPDGDGVRRLDNRLGDASYLYHLNNAGKRSVIADIRTASGRELALDILRSADALIENFSPGALEGRGLGYADVCKVNPEIVYCSVNGFGSSGPLSRERAYDVVVQGLCGIVSLCGDEDGRAVKVGPSVVDMMGASVGAAALCAALYHRRRSGHGQRIDLAMYDVGAWLTSELWPSSLDGDLPARVGNRHRFHGSQNAYAALDGTVAIAVETDVQEQALSRLVGGAEASQPAPENDVAEWMRRHTLEKVVSACQANGIPAAPVLELDTVVRLPALWARDMLVEVPGPEGPAIMFGSPYKMSRTPGRVTKTAEAAGASTAAVVSELASRLRPGDSRKIGDA